MNTKKTLKNKDTFPKVWDFSPLFSGDEDPAIEESQKESLKESYKFINKWKDRADYLERPKALKQALDEYNKWLEKTGSNSKVIYYFHLRTEQEEDNLDLRAKFNKAHQVAIQIENDIQFFTMRLSKIPEAKQQEFLASSLLKNYHKFLKALFLQAKYLLSESEEKIINLYSKTSYSNWVKMTSALLSEEEAEVLISPTKKEKKSFSELMTLMSNPEEKVRKSAFQAFNQIVGKYKKVAGEELNSVLEYKKTGDDLRKSSRPDYLRHLHDDIETEVVDAMLEAVESSFKLSQKFYSFKKKILGLKKFHYYERNLGIEFGKKKTYDFEEGVKLVDRVLGRLDGQMQEIFRDFVNKKQLDVFPRKGKTSGAFCSHQSKPLPTYILLNHTGELRDVTTLAHEVGHGLNNELIKQKQPEIYFETKVSTAEVASTFVEDFVLEELLRTADDKQKLTLLMAKLDDEVATIFRQTAAYRFEQELHERFRQEGYLPHNKIGEIFAKWMKAYTGEEIIYPEGTENWWVYWSHFRNFFYVYSYASGLLISKALQAKVRENPEFISKVKEFLSTGTSDSPKNIFSKLGIDISDKNFWQGGIKEFERNLEELVTLARKLGRIK